jgi:large subunit ribosomal protein L20
MARAKRGYKGRRRHKKILKRAEGFTNRRKNTIRRGSEAVDRASVYAYTGRKHRKRDFRALWITRINAALAAHGVNYSSFIAQLKKAEIALDRKVLSDLAIVDAAAFGAVVKQAYSANA